MIEFVLALIGFLLVIVLSVFFGIGVLAYAIFKIAKEGESLLVTYDYEKKEAVCLRGHEFEFTILDKK